VRFIDQSLKLKDSSPPICRETSKNRTASKVAARVVARPQSVCKVVRKA